MFDLEKSIRDWSLALTRTESVSDDNVHELAEHLRQTITELVGKGLTQQEAFAVGKTRLGESSALSEEYSKVNGGFVWRRRILWMLFGYVGGSAFAKAVSGISALAGSTSALMGLRGATAGAVSVTAAAVGWSVALLAVYHWPRQRAAGTRHDHVSIRWLAVACAMLAIGPCMATLGTVLHSRVVEVSEFGEFALWSTIGSTAVQLCTFVVCVGMIVALRDNPRKESKVVA